MNGKLKIIFLSAILIINVLANAQEKQYLEFVTNDYGTILGSNSFYPSTNKENVSSQLDHILNDYIKQLPIDTITYYVYFGNDIRDIEKFDTLYVPGPAPEFLIKQRNLVYIRQEKLPECKRIDLTDFCKYFAKQFDCCKSENERY